MESRFSRQGVGSSNLASPATKPGLILQRYEPPNPNGFHFGSEFPSLKSDFEHLLAPCTGVPCRPLNRSTDLSGF